MAALKVWGCLSGYVRDDDGSVYPQARQVVAAPSRAAAAKAFGVTSNWLKVWGSDTGNPAEVEVALAEPGVVFWHPLDERPPRFRRSKV